MASFEKHCSTSGDSSFSTISLVLHYHFSINRPEFLTIHHHGSELSVGSVGHSLFDFTFHSSSNDFLAFLLLVWLLLNSKLRLFIETLPQEDLC